jgi:hypothetical protein
LFQDFSFLLSFVSNLRIAGEPDLVGVNVQRLSDLGSLKVLVDVLIIVARDPSWLLVLALIFASVTVSVNIEGIDIPNQSIDGLLSEGASGSRGVCLANSSDDLSELNTKK